MVRKTGLAIVVALAFCSALSHAGEGKNITNPAEIAKILADIPVKDKEMNYRNIGERLANVGMTVKGIRIYTIDNKSEIESPLDRVGDKHIAIYTTNPSQILKQYYCNMLGSPSFLKRGKKYYPEDRTGMWLTTSRCELPPDQF